MKLRILYVSHSFPVRGKPLTNVGGMQRIAVDIQHALDAHPEVTLTSLCLEASGKWADALTLPFIAKLLGQIPRVVEREKIDAVLFSSMVTASVVALMQDRLRTAGAITAAIPVGRDITLPNPLYQRFVPKVLRTLDVLFPISNATADAARIRGAPNEKLHVVPCGVDLPSLTIEGDRSVSRTRLLSHLRNAGHNVDPESLLLLSVGRHQPRKGFQWFVESVMPRVGPKVSYLLAGSGPMTEPIRNIVATRNIGDRVFLLGRVSEDELAMLYRGSDLFIMPNIPVEGDMEGFGVVMIEAGAAGLPVIAADLEGISDVIALGKNGVRVPPMDAAGFTDQVERYRDRELLRHDSASAAAYVRSTFGWGGIIESYVTILRERLSVSKKADEAAKNRQKTA